MSDRRTPPLLVTLSLEPPAQEQIEAWRQEFFPSERNFVPAHVTLFHHLPGDQEAAVRAALAIVTAETAPFPVRFIGSRFLGRGFALAIEAPALLDVRRELARTCAAWLTSQDSQPYRPHATLMNKAEPSVAKRARAAFQAVFTPFEAKAAFLVLWRYLGGPWDSLATFDFKKSNTSTHQEPARLK